MGRRLYLLSLVAAFAAVWTWAAIRALDRDDWLLENALVFIFVPHYLPVELTLAFSALYELIEWGAAALVSPEAGLAFLGTQGDPWDGQKDMAMAGLGAVIAMLLTYGVASVIEPDTWKDFKESLRIPPDDRPVGEDQVLAWWRHRRRCCASAARRRGS